MKKSKEIIRLHIQTELSRRQIALAMNVSRPVVSKTISRWEESGLVWDDLEGMRDSDFHQTLYSLNKPPGKAEQLIELFPHFSRCQHRS